MTNEVNIWSDYTKSVEKIQVMRVTNMNKILLHIAKTEDRLSVHQAEKET